MAALDGGSSFSLVVVLMAGSFVAAAPVLLATFLLGLVLTHIGEWVNTIWPR